MLKRSLFYYGLLASLLHGQVARAQNPGGVSVSAWYKADATGALFSNAGTTTVTDNTTVYQWNESTGTGFNLLQAAAGSRPVFSNTTTLANFNPTVTFDGSNDYLQFTAGTGINIIDRADGSLYAAGYVNTQKRNGFVGFHPTMDYPGLHEFSDNKLLFFTGGPGYQGKSADAMAAKSYFTAGTGWENGAGSSAAYAGATVSLNGTRTSYSGTQLYNANLSTGARDLRIGGDNNYGAFSGQLNEILVFENRLSPAEMDKVESYLAIKYGSTYAAGTRDYKNASGATVWTATANAGYNNNIAGIANDGALNQKQSWSTKSNREVLISTTGLANTNAGNATALTAGQYLIWGDNGLSKAPTVGITGITGISHRFAAIWKVQNTSAVGTVRIAWVKNLANLSLIQSNDATFSAADAVTSMTGNEITVNGVVYNYADVTLANGSYFTFAAKVAAPGGVTANLRVWLKANAGFTPSEWYDYSGNANHYTQTNLTRQPFTGTKMYNFNPVVDFGGAASSDARFMVVPAGQPYSANGSNSSVFTVNLDRGVGGYADILGFGATTTTSSLINANLPVFTRLGTNVVTYPYSDASPALPAVVANKLYLNDVSYTVGTAGIKYAQNGTTGSNTQTFAAGYAKHADGSVLGSQPEVRNGLIGEVIAYERDLTEPEKQRIRTYSAIKYGITLPHNYTASDGTTIVWDQTANTGYGNNIAGLANDEASMLSQKQSNSINNGQQLIVATTGLNNSNALNTTSLSNNQYLVIGDNGLAQSLSTGFVYPSMPALNLRFGAIWKVQNTGSVGTVRIAWPEGVPSINLIQSGDAIFDDTDVFTDMTSNTVVINGVTYNYADVTLANGSYFTFTGYVVGPGNVASAAWYRADATGQQFTDAGTTAATDNTSLYQWNEYKGTGYNLEQTGAGDRPIFSNAQTLANFNPTVTFNGSQWMRYTAGTGVNVIDRANGTIYAAGQLKSIVNAGIAGFNASMDYPGLHTWNTGGGDYKLLFYTGGPGYNGLSSNSFSRNQYFIMGSAWQNGDGSSATYAGGTVSLNGIREIYTGTSDFQNAVINNASRDFQIGEDNNAGPLNGQLNEVVVFENELTGNEMDRVETYMAIKYGTTYANGTRNYVNSSSATVWSATNNAGYISNIAGIARDNQGSINQKQSWSANPGQQVLISTTGLANTNAANPTGLTDGQFLIWGDNGLAKSPSVAITSIADVNYRFASIWKAENTNNVGSVRVAWPKGLSNLKLIRSADATIDGTDNVTDMENTQVVNGVEYAYADVTLNNGQYFTFAAFLQAPGGVTNGLSHWYRADKYVQANGDNTDVTAWTDFTSGITSEQIEDVALPKFKTGDTTYLNFNPGVNFTATAQKLGNINTQTLTSLNFDIFSATKEGMSGSRFFNIGMDNTTLNGNNWDQPGLYVDGNIARRTNTASGLLVANPGSVAFTANQPNIMYHSFSDLDMAKGVNGKALGTAFTHSARGLVTGGHIFGSNAGAGTSGDDAGFVGSIGELVIYGNGTITAAQRNKVDAYLAIKYGVTLDTANNYTTSQDVVVWNKTLNKGFYNNVAGIGHDYISALQQKQSRSQRINTNGQVIMSLDQLAATNAANTGSVEDGQFLLWGDNNVAQAMTATASTYTTFSYAGGTNNGRRMNRIWKVQNTDVDQPMQVFFPRTSVGTVTLPAGDACAAYAILFADDSAMTTNLVALPLSMTEDSVQYIVSHTFPNGMSYFSFGKVTPLDNGNVYLPAVVESTEEYNDNCGVGEWINYHQTGNVSEKMFGIAGFAATDLDSLQLTITPEGTSYDDGVRTTNLMPRITHVADSNTSVLPTGKVRVYYSADELAGTSVPGYITQGWFKYAGDAEAVLTDVYDNGIFETGKAIAITPAATGVEDGVNYVEFHGVSSFSSFVYLSSTENLGTVLPVTLTSFIARAENDKVLLQWVTASEQNNRGFAIERSADSKDWIKIGFVQSKAAGGNSASQLSYQEYDREPLQGLNYYRLKQTDFDGRYVYSSIRQVSVNNASAVSIHPNPTQDLVMVNGLDGKETIHILDASGRKVKEMKATGSSVTIELSGMPQGLYHIQIVSPQGQVVSRKVVKL